MNVLLIFIIFLHAFLFQRIIMTGYYGAHGRLTKMFLEKLENDEYLSNLNKTEVFI